VAKLTRDQARRYSERIARLLAWMVTARKRMDRLGVSGELYQQTLKAEHALLSLRMTAHYASCPDVTGGRDEPEETPPIRTAATHEPDPVTG
jgi:hypothetical protein